MAIVYSVMFAAKNAKFNWKSIYPETVKIKKSTHLNHTVPFVASLWLILEEICVNMMSATGSQIILLGIVVQNHLDISFSWMLQEITKLDYMILKATRCLVNYYKKAKTLPKVWEKLL